MLDANTEIEEEKQADEDADPCDAGTFVPVVAHKLSEQDAIRKTVQERQTGSSDPNQILPWPKSGDDPINEFNTKDTSRVHFPHYFPRVRLTLLPHATTM